MKKVWQILIFVLILVTLTSLGIYAFTPRTQLLRYFVPKMSFVKISNLLVQNNQASLQLHLQATSSFLPVYVSKLQYNFKLYNQSISQGNQNLTSQQSNKSQPITLPLRLNYTKALSLFQRQLSDNRSVNAEFKLLCRIPLFGTETITSTEILPFTIPVLVAPTITHLATEEIGFQHLQVMLTLHVTNRNKFDYYLRNLSVNAQFPDYRAVAHNVREDYLIKANQVTPIKILSAKAIAKADKNKLFRSNSPVAYNLQTVMLLEPVNASIDQITFQSTQSGTITAAQKI